MQIICTTNYCIRFILWSFFLLGGTKKIICLLGFSFKTQEQIMMTILTFYVFSGRGYINCVTIICTLSMFILPEGGCQKKIITVLFVMNTLWLFSSSTKLGGGVFTSTSRNYHLHPENCYEWHVFSSEIARVSWLSSWGCLLRYPQKIWKSAHFAPNKGVFIREVYLLYIERYYHFRSLLVNTSSIKWRGRGG